MIHTIPRSQLGDLDRMVSGILPRNIAIATGNPLLAAGGLHPQEEIATGRMNAARKAEYTCGRHVARCAMNELGYGTDPVPMGPDRAPVWPDGVVGSISHSADACIALAAAADDYRSLGVDLEPDQPLAQDLIAEICRAEERDWLWQKPEKIRGRLARLIFSAKEAAYKAQYPVTGLLFGFDRFSIRFDFATGSFSARFTQTTGIFGNDECLYGKFMVGHGLIVTVVTVPALVQKG